MAQINQVAEGISTFLPTVGISLKPFFIDDEHPMLIHTGAYLLYEGVCQTTSDILDPKQFKR